MAKTREKGGSVMITQLAAEIKAILKDISCVTDTTKRNDTDREEIGFMENPLNPNLLAYCFDVILGFNVRYRPFEKVHYFIEFDYKGTYASVGHYKLSYRVSIDNKYRSEFIDVLLRVKPLIENLFMAIGEEALVGNHFSMKNEAPEYFSKLAFYQERIESLESRWHIVEEKCHGKYDVIKDEDGYTHMRQKGSKYLHSLENEITYDIEAYIDTFFSALEHVLTLLYPFAGTFSSEESYYKKYIRNTKWAWDAKIRDVCGNKLPEAIFSDLRRIKEVYRNHNAHGGFSREMMAYIQIPRFGRYPMYVGREYLKGFTDGCEDTISYEMYLEAKTTFEAFWSTLDALFEIPMLFIRSGLSIPVDTTKYMSGITTIEQAKYAIEKMWYDIYNQYNMDW
jgi:hypothetical protein